MERFRLFTFSDVMFFVAPILLAGLQYRLCQKSVSRPVKLIPVWILAAWAVINLIASQMLECGFVLYFAYISSWTWIVNAVGVLLGFICSGIHRWIQNRST